MSLRSYHGWRQRLLAKTGYPKYYAKYFYNRYCYVSMTFRKDEETTNIAQLGERHTVVLEVTGSNPVIRFRQVAEWYTRR